MKRLAIITVGPTHSGKTSFAKALEDQLPNSFVMDQDNHASFINAHYQKLQPVVGTNTLKHAVSLLIVNYAKENTDLHLIVSNANRSRKGRRYLLEDVFPSEAYHRILVYFDIPEEVLLKRVMNSERDTTIFRSAASFHEVLKRQSEESKNNDDITAPTHEEADDLFVVKELHDVETTVKKIVSMAEVMKGKKE
ncbi:AAA family ATPase [Alkalihalobacillus pseudalcaliphilus]|uniref:AAA family ATPase n=1 Tax=Alkalihalobacillus pseudalcaliphilus TaxID=79884 RepID=UPI00064D92E3|nr:AAA family ATPase [Alkalihalobacillus pseudalcaliphilus]KMK74357.1 CRISPR-associated protein Cas2 [Alkalihalobacillus pseudalcaliphilus]